jgi:hypothetical protein
MLQRRPTRPHWTAREIRLARRLAQALKAGRFAGRSEAVWAFEQEAARRRRRKASGFESPRTRWAISHKIWREAGHPVAPLSPRSVRRERRPWYPEECRVRDAFARALARGRYRSALDASRAFLAERKLLRRRYPRARWLAPERTLTAVYAQMGRRARELGRPTGRWWTIAEHRLVDALARRVTTGRIPSALRAAHEFIRLGAERRARYPKLAEQYPPRSIRVTHTRIWSRAQELGRPLLAVLWSPEEIELLERHARRVLTGEARTAKAASSDCVQALERLHRRFPNARWSKRHRNFGTVFLKLKKVLHARAAVWRQSKLTDAESRLLDRYAREVASGRFALRAAASACYREIVSRYRRFLSARPDLTVKRMPRTWSAVHAQLVMRSRAIGRRPGWRPWDEVESALARKWMLKFKKTRHRRRFFSSHAAARELRRELRARGYRRRQSSCRNKILILLYGRTPRPHVSDSERQRRSRSAAHGRNDLTPYVNSGEILDYRRFRFRGRDGMARLS